MKTLTSVILIISLMILSVVIPTKSSRPPSASLITNLPPYTVSHSISCASHKIASYTRCACYRAWRHRLLKLDLRSRCRNTFRSQLRVMKHACPTTPLLPLIRETLDNCFVPALGDPGDKMLIEGIEVAEVRQLAQIVDKLLTERRNKIRNKLQENMAVEVTRFDPYAGWMGSEEWLHGGRHVM